MSAPRVTPIKLPLANAYLVRDERPILVDAGYTGDERRIVAALAAEGLAPRDLGLIVLTHGHGDHIGAAAALARLSGAPLALHRDDWPLAASGRNGLLVPTRASARVMAAIFGGALRPVEPFTPDLALDEGLDLTAYGVRGRLLHTPGHTPGSVSLLLEGGQALAGDLLMGGHLGGALAGRRPRYHYFAASMEQVRASLGRLLAAGATRLFVGHGGPLEAAEVRQRIMGGAQAAPAPR
ncbi:MAG TPA: MBL fold metallo-hydrolase [Chloroflexaceae bacterium]|nr:MBL fold metallo-hydrolase [Chloroflexaceae bacterium]